MWRQVAALCEKASAESGAKVGVRIANYLCNGNYAISGSLEACEAAEKLAKDFGARKMVRLQVAGAFHTSFMQPAEEKLRWALLFSCYTRHIASPMPDACNALLMRVAAVCLLPMMESGKHAMASWQCWPSTQRGKLF